MKDLNIKTKIHVLKCLKQDFTSMKLQKRDKENLKNVSEKTDIGWGHQIRHTFYNLINL